MIDVRKRAKEIKQQRAEAAINQATSRQQSTAGIASSSFVSFTQPLPLPQDLFKNLDRNILLAILAGSANAGKVLTAAINHSCSSNSDDVIMAFDKELTALLDKVQAIRADLQSS
ncbi:hypothetical protein [Acetobacter lambici]|uniref:Uncharacterized protein n=1 Tax=Acetobacter lambici TaxID=1332824 RepID=A0ABT1EZG2_9PROT|nr:hypothetical protein [Acetobacter lambici]MCP1243263.1 hypothetical protein [Acetobacter lambici]MCP1258336.1 hypothetical protein [Acetobacter lambici]